MVEVLDKPISSHHPLFLKEITIIIINAHMSSGALYCTIASLGGRVTRDSMDIPGIHTCN